MLLGGLQTGERSEGACMTLATSNRGHFGGTSISRGIGTAAVSSFAGSPHSEGRVHNRCGLIDSMR